MRLSIKHAAKTGDNEAFFIIDNKELSKFGIKKEILFNPTRRGRDYDYFIGELCWYANATLFGGKNNTIACKISQEDENTTRFTFIEEPYDNEYDDSDCYYPETDDYESDLEYYDDEYDEYERISDLIENREGPVGLVVVNSFSNCLKTIGFLRSYNNKIYEVYNIKNKYFINVKGCDFPADRLSEYCAGVTDVYVEYYADMIKAYVQEHGGETFEY